MRFLSLFRRQMRMQCDRRRLANERRCDARKQVGAGVEVHACFPISWTRSRYFSRSDVTSAGIIFDLSSGVISSLIALSSLGDFAKVMRAVKSFSRSVEP